jgi:methenyltetrahydromethanopterin cyclohydrolase
VKTSVRDAAPKTVRVPVISLLPDFSVGDELAASVDVAAESVQPARARTAAIATTAGRPVTGRPR